MKVRQTNYGMYIDLAEFDIDAILDNFKEAVNHNTESQYHYNADPSQPAVYIRAVT